jgi:hypothetical protein
MFITRKVSKFIPHSRLLVIYAVSSSVADVSRQKRFSIPVAERTKARLSGGSLAGILASNPAGGIYVSFESCQVEVSAMGRSLIQRSPTNCGVTLCVM